jgi:hypothetical protein
MPCGWSEYLERLGNWFSYSLELFEHEGDGTAAPFMYKKVEVEVVSRAQIMP